MQCLVMPGAGEVKMEKKKEREGKREGGRNEVGVEILLL